MTDIDDWVGRNIPQSVLDDAAAWMALLDSERCHEADRLAFTRWLDEDPCHQWAFEEMSAVWARLHTLADVRPLLDDSKVVCLPTAGRQPGAAPAMPIAPKSDWTALVASLLVIAGALIHLLAGNPATTYRTAVGSTLDFTLVDGTRVEMNARSRMDVRMNADIRNVELADGDAVFHVKPDSRPFKVTTGRGEITALGTSFAVTTSESGLDVSVLEGEVSVRRIDRRALLTEFDRGAVPLMSSGETRLSAGERLTMSAGYPVRQLVSDVGSGSQLAWRYGIVEFDRQPLAAVIDDMRRYLDVNIHIADPEIASLRISGRFSTEGSAGLLRELELNPAIRVDRSEPRWIILRSTMAALQQ